MGGNWALLKRAASTAVWVDGVFVLGYAGGETLGAESLASICRMWYNRGNYDCERGRII